MVAVLAVLAIALRRAAEPCQAARTDGRAQDDRVRGDWDPGNRAAGAARCWCCPCVVLICLSLGLAMLALFWNVGCTARWLGRRAGVRVSAGVSCLAGSRAGADHVLHVLCVLEFCAAQAVLRAADAVSGVHCCWRRA